MPKRFGKATTAKNARRTVRLMQRRAIIDKHQAQYKNDFVNDEPNELCKKYGYWILVVDNYPRLSEIDDKTIEEFSKA